jgi:hypothetical protein
MDRQVWLPHGHDLTQPGSNDSYGKLLEIMSRLEECDDPKFTPEQVEFFKSLITSLIDTIRSFKAENKS